MPDSLPPPDRLRIKTETSLSGQACCPSCGGLLSTSPDQCTHCGWNRRDRAAKPARPRRARAVGLGWLTTPFRWLVRTLFILVLLVAVAAAITWAYQRWWPAPLVERAPVPCETCLGTGFITCTHCGGTGQVEGQPISIPCDQCDGKGNYSKRISPGVSKCPFCKGTGIKGTKTVRETCSVCQGKGRVSCPDCQGAGRRRGP